jgi:osmoprotectant transport system permease protein
VSGAAARLRPRLHAWLGFALALLLLVLAFVLFAQQDAWAAVLARLFPQQRIVMFERTSLLALAWQHVRIVAAALGLILVIGLPLGVWLTRRSGQPFLPLASNLLSAGQSFPPVAVLALALPFFGFGLRPTLIALTAYGLLPVTRNVIAGLQGVPADLKEAGTAMGMGPAALFWRVEVPLALRDLYSGRELGRMLSFAMVFFTSAPLLAPSIGALILRFGDWHLTFVFLLLVAIAMVLMVLLLLPETLSKPDPHALNLQGILLNARKVFLEPRSGWAVVLMTLGFGTLMAYLTTAPTLFITYFGVSETTFALLFSAIACVSFITQPINARLLRTYSSVQILQVVVPVFVLVSVIMLLQAALGVATLTSLVINLTAFFACFSLTLANGTVLALDPHRERAGMASGLMGFAQMAFGTLLGSIIGSYAGLGPLPMTIGIALLACLMYPAFRLAVRAHG